LRILVGGLAGIFLISTPAGAQSRFSGLRAQGSNPTRGFKTFSSGVSSGMLSSAYSLPSSSYRGGSLGVQGLPGTNGSSSRYYNTPSPSSFGSLSLSGGTGYRGSNSGSFANSLEAFSASSYNAPVFNPNDSFFSKSGGDIIPLAPTAPSVTEAFELARAASALEATKPFVEKELQRPAKNQSTTRPVSDLTRDIEGRDDIFSSDSNGITTNKGALITAQQISKARDMVRQKMYIQAFNFYKAARTVDQKNVNSLIGMIYCQIMNGRFQVAGLEVLQLAQDSPAFWVMEPNFNAVFSIPGDEIARRFLDVEPRIDTILSFYRPEEEKSLAEDMKLICLSKMFIAWLKQDQEGIRTSAELAAKLAPLDAPIQQLYHKIIGKSQNQEFTLTPIKPME